jgi:2-polyprenyl-3-methyl-5-hydroxy-6-metoxy-1,4-benzoquinol methylase
MQINCPLCNSTEIKYKFKKRGSPFFKCPQCRFVFQHNNDNPNFQNNLTDFETAYLNYFESSRADKKNHNSLLQWIQKYKPGTDYQLLDIGCGSGKFVNYLNTQGYKSFGIEPSVPVYNHFLANNSVFECTSVIDYINKVPGNVFDIITAFDVLEHVKDPVEFLTGIASLLHKDSLLFISTPDVGSFHRKLTGKHWHYFNKYHFSFFSKNTIRLAAKMAGLELLNVSHRSRYFQLKYIRQYFYNFILTKKTNYSSSGSGMITPLNLFDIMYCVLKKQ